MRQQRIREGLALSDSSAVTLAWRDSLTGLSYLRRASDLAQRGLTLNLHAYQCHVFLDWHELHSTAEQPWDRLSDQLRGKGVANLEDALINLELQPVQDALRALLEPGIVRLFADLAEHPRALAAGTDPEIEAKRAEFFEAAWARCESFLRLGQRSYLSRGGSEANGAKQVNPALLRAAFRDRLRAAMRIPAIEALFPAPWTVAARRMLPSPSPQLTATAMWGPVLGWCVLELLAESIDAANSVRVALDLFDRLRLREPFAKALAALGFEGEEAWRVAARVKVGLLTGAGVGEPQEASTETATVSDGRVALLPALWLDPDVRWLTGVHESEGQTYLVRELYEELLWWLAMPSLLRLAGESAPSRAAVETMSRTIADALATAEAVGYRVDLLLGPATPEDGGDEAVHGVEPAANPEVEAEAPRPPAKKRKKPAKPKSKRK
jgi:hypothetical protein